MRVADNVFSRSLLHIEKKNQNEALGDYYFSCMLLKFALALKIDKTLYAAH